MAGYVRMTKSNATSKTSVRSSTACSLVLASLVSVGCKTPEQQSANAAALGDAAAVEAGAATEAGTSRSSSPSEQTANLSVGFGETSPNLSVGLETAGQELNDASLSSNDSVVGTRDAGSSFPTTDTSSTELATASPESPPSSTPELTSTAEPTSSSRSPTSSGREQSTPETNATAPDGATNPADGGSIEDAAISHSQGCADDTSDALGNSAAPDVVACGGVWDGDIANAGALCAEGWHVCLGDEPAIKALSYEAALAQPGCFAFDAAHDNGTCWSDCSAHAGTVDSYANLDLAAFGGDCPFELANQTSCLGSGRIDASENSGTGCDYHSGLTGALCCRGEAVCNIGESTSLATPETVQLFGAVSYYAEGAVLDAGRYRVTYVDGCMKYSSAQDWAIHAYADGSIAWYLGSTTGDKAVLLPGTVGILEGAGGYADFEACVQANLQLEPVEFEFAGGQLGVWVADSNYGDNVPGEANRNPKWRLERLGACD